MIQSGEIIRFFRKGKNIKMKELCTGVCTTAFMSQIENGQKNPNAIVFEFLMERMGVSLGEYAIMANEDEYVYFMWREKVYNAIENKEWNNLKELLQDMESFGSIYKQSIVLQLNYYIKGVLEIAENKNYSNATEYFKIAIIQTNPDLFQSLEIERVLGEKELHIVILYLYYGILSKTIDIKLGKEIFYKLEKGIFDKEIGIQEKAKLYSKLACIGINVLEKELDDREKKGICLKAIELLRKGRCFHDVIELLRLCMTLINNEGNMEICYYKKQYEIFVELFQGAAISIDFRPEYMVCGKPKIYLITEYLYSKRKEMKLTHEKTSEDIYDVASYSRVERGKTKPFPCKLYKLAEKLEIPWCYYRGELETDSLEAYRLRKENRSVALAENWERVLDILAEMEKMLDMQNSVNYQYVKSEQCLALYRLKRISEEEAYAEMKKLLALTKRIEFETPYLTYYSQTELEIVVCMAQMLRKQGKYQEGIYLLEKVFKQFERSKVGVEYQWGGVDFGLRELSELYFCAGDYNKSLELLKYVYKINVRKKECGNMPVILDAMADNLEHMGKEYSEQYKMLYRQTYYIAEFFYIDQIKVMAQKYYEDNFDENYVWY